MFKLRIRDRYGNEIVNPENNPIIDIQCNAPVIDMLDNWVDPEDDYDCAMSVADLLNLVKRDLEGPEKLFLEDDLRRLFEAVGMENA